VSALSGVRLSMRAIAKLLVVGVGAVHRELGRTSGVPTGTPEESNGQPSTLAETAKSTRGSASRLPRFCRTCGDPHLANAKACLWTPSLKALVRTRGTVSVARADDEVTYSKPEYLAPQSKPLRPPKAEPPDGGNEKVAANANSDQILQLIDRAECVPDEIAQLEDIVVTLASAVASRTLAVGAPELSVRIRKLRRLPTGLDRRRRVGAADRGGVVHRLR